jgi:hypothetical protein
MSVERRDIERLRYWQGQTLASRDLRDQLAHDASLRWWHNRTIHDAWGIVEGLVARVAGGKVRVSPGIAYDCFGRELILASRRTVALPPSGPADRAWLLLLRAASKALTARTPSQPTVELVWKAAGAVLDPRLGVPLARGRYDDEIFELEPIEHGASRGAGAVTRPRLGSGATVRGRTDWRPWVDRVFDIGVVGGIEVEIDTSAAGFERAPCYFAWLHGPRLLGVEAGSPGTSGLAGLARIGFERVLRARPDGFVFNLVFPPAPRFQLFALEPRAAVIAAPSGVAALHLARRELSVCWLGIEARVPTAAGSKAASGERRATDCRER